MVYLYIDLNNFKLRFKLLVNQDIHSQVAPILFPIPYMATHKQGNKETSNNQRQKKNEMKAKPIEF